MAGRPLRRARRNASQFWVDRIQKAREQHGAELSYTNLRGANFTGANLHGTIFQNTIMPDGSRRDS